MLSRLRRQLTYANVVSTLCLFMLLGGSAYAAAKIGSAQIKNNSIQSKDVKNKSLQSKDFEPGELPSGARGPAGVGGSAGPQGPSGGQGPAGDPGRSALTPLRSGETVRGVTGFSGVGGNFASAYESLPVPAPTPLDNAHVNVDGPDDAGDVCKGSSAAPTAPAGYVCVYPSFTASTIAGLAGYGETAYGFSIFAYVNGSSGGGVSATWAYTAP